MPVRLFFFFFFFSRLLPPVKEALKPRQDISGAHFKSNQLCISISSRQFGAYSRRFIAKKVLLLLFLLMRYPRLVLKQGDLAGD